MSRFPCFFSDPPSAVFTDECSTLSDYHLFFQQKEPERNNLKSEIQKQHVLLEVEITCEKLSSEQKKVIAREIFLLIYCCAALENKYTVSELENNFHAAQKAKLLRSDSWFFTTSHGLVKKTISFLKSVSCTRNVDVGPIA